MAAKTLFLCALWSIVAASANKITVDSEGRYQNVVVVIGEEIKESQQLLDNLRVVLKEASDAMTYVSRHHQRRVGGFSFGEINIVVPGSWQLAANLPRAGLGLLQGAPIRVEPANVDRGSEPYTLQPGGCGEPGRYIHLTPEYLLSLARSRDAYGHIGKTLVHQWAHVRWGVFDEYNDKGGPHFYIKEGRLVPVRCVEELEGRPAVMSTLGRCFVNRQELQVEPNCRFYLKNDNTAKASIMFAHHLRAVQSFCNATTDKSMKHNDQAPNPHNRMCGKRSVWEVLLRHSDFKAAVPQEAVRNTTFRLLRTETQRNVSLVLDVSGSMGKVKGGVLPLDKLKIAAMKLLLNDIESSARVGITTFSNVVTEVRPLQLMKSDTVRDLYTDAVIRLKAKGYTAVGDGLIKGGMRQFGYDPRYPSEFTGTGTIVLLTDGEENRGQYRIPRAIELIARTSVVVHVISFGRKADVRLPELARRTGGRHYFAADDKRGVDLMNVMAAMVQSGAPPKTKPIDVISGTLGYIRSEITRRYFQIDRSTNKNIFLTFSYDKRAPVDLELTSPDGRKYNKSNTNTYKENVLLQTITINVAGESQTGKWSLAILPRNPRRWKRAPAPAASLGQLVISGRATEDTPILLSGSVTPRKINQLNGRSQVRIFASLMRGTQAIPDAEVFAYVGAAPAVRMADDGVGPDNVKGDGIYSCFAPLPGLYNRGVAGDVSVRVSCIRPVSRNAAVAAITVASFGRYNPALDTVPPAAVTDLQAVPNLADKTVKLIWTAVGDDLYQGNVSSYEVLVSAEPKKIGRPIDTNGLGVRLVVQPSGSPQTLLLSDKVLYKSANLSSSSSPTYYLTVRGVDAAGNKAEDSNVASTMLSEPSNLSEFTTSRGLSGGAVAAIVIVVLLVLVAAIAAAYIFRKKLPKLSPV